MYLSPAEIASGRQLSLNNFQTASAACVSASGRLAELFSRLGRQQLDMLRRQSGPRPAPGELLSGVQYQSAELLGELLGIIGDVQQTVIIASAAQTRVVDQLLMTVLDRARSTSPAEALPALVSLRQGIATLEQGLDGWTGLARTSCASLAASQDTAARTRQEEGGRP